MPTTRKQKKARKSRGLEMLSDIENIDIMLGENHFNAREREGSLNSNLPTRSRSLASNESENENGNVDRNQRNDRSKTNTEYDQNSVTANSSAEINRLSSELNSRISREMDEMMNSVSVQIQRAISDAISTQVLPQIQNVIMAGSGHGTRKGWNVPSKRPELNSEVQRNLNAKINLRNEQDGNQSDNDFPGLNVHDMVTGDNESPNPVPEFLTGRIPSRSHLNQSHEDINLDTTIPAHERRCHTCVETVSYFLFGTKELNGQRVDIWGDGCEIGGVETTRIAFRILTDKIKCQSSDAVFCFAAYRGKDSSFAMEQNLGPTIAGVQESGWLFMKTLELSKRGVILTYSGDSPFLMRLVLGITNESASPSKMPLYVTERDYTPTKCHHETGLRSDVIIPFRKDLPKSFLVFYENIQSV